MGDLNKRKGIVQGSEQEADDTVMTAHVPLASMFGYSTDLRSMTQVGSQILICGYFVCNRADACNLFQASIWVDLEMNYQDLNLDDSRVCPSRQLALTTKK